MIKYYTLTEKSPAYVAALVLNPQWKWTYFEKQWEEAWYIQAKLYVRRFWEESYKSYNTAVPVEEEEVVENEFIRWRKNLRGPVTVRDEYDIYLSTPTVPIEDARAWWQEPTQRATFPHLSKMALDLLSIPAMSAEPEHLFSSCKITITDRRNKLGIEAIEAIECLKSWMKNDTDSVANIPYIDGIDGIITPLTEENLVNVTRQAETGVSQASSFDSED